MSDTETSSEPVAVFKRAVKEGLDAEDEQVVMETFAESVDVLQDDGPKAMSPQQIWQQHQVERAAMPDYVHEIQDVWQSGKMIFAQYRAEATFENELRLGQDIAFEPTGETLETAGIIQARVEDGEITGWGAYWNKLELFQQAGIVPPLSELAER
jgi:hypothetical protein